MPVAYDGDEAVFGKIGGADRFDGVNDAVLIGDDPSLDVGDSVTLSAWVYAERWEPVLENAVIRKNGDYRLLNRDTGLFTFKLQSSTDIVVGDAIANYGTGRWYYVVGTYDRSIAGDNARLYRNGRLAAKVYSDVVVNSTTDDLYIGSKDGALQYFVGVIDEARVSYVGRSSNWVWACWLNQASNTTFLGCGPVTGPGVDADEDGMIDEWERSHFGSITNADTTTDADKDGFLDYAEDVAGTDPTNALSLLRISEFDASGGSNIVIQWPSETGRFYSIGRRTNLLEGGWTIIYSDIEDTSVLNVFTVDVPSVEAVFHRIGVRRE